MKLGKQMAAGALALSLLALPVTAGAVDQIRLDTGTAAAETLHSLGLFRGADLLPDGSPDFQLTREATRGEGLVMLIRLLGAEQDALTTDYSHPFTDAGWADDYCGYAYEHQIANGTSETTFGTSAPISRDHFLTLVLRALGYSQVDWRDPTPLAGQVGLWYPEAGEFLRCDMAQICLSALDCAVNGTVVSLRTQLQQAGVIPDGSIVPSVREPGPVTAAYSYLKTNTPEELLPELLRAMNGRSATLMLNVPAGLEQAYGQYVKNYTEAMTDVERWSSSWYPDSGVINLEMTYQDGVRVMAYLEGKISSLEPQDQQLLAAALQVRDTCTLSGMTDYEIVKAYHDYLVNNTTYRGGADINYTAAGPLLTGYGVCDGYSKAFDLLCYLSGIDCIRVSGTGNGGAHAWNKVKVDGVWYNVDVTWDDPISSRPVLRYDYFLISDSTLGWDHSWVQYDHLPTSSMDYPD